MKVSKLLAVTGLVMSLMFGGMWGLTTHASTIPCSHDGSINTQQWEISRTITYHDVVTDKGSKKCTITTIRYRRVMICTKCGAEVANIDFDGKPQHSIAH